VSRRELRFPPERMADGTVRIRTIPLPPRPTATEIIRSAIATLNRIDARLARLEHLPPARAKR
jgi:hypothetical protein